MIEYTVRVYPSGDKHWYLNGELHREDGPAIECADGDKSWYFHGKLHRGDGPAAEWPDGRKFWYLNGELHREDGPAIEWADGRKAWWLNNQRVTEEEHRRWWLVSKPKPKVKELTVQEIGDLLGYEVKVVKG